MNKRIKAFTLVELLASIVIIAIIGGIGVIGYRAFFKTGEEKFYENVENDLMLAGNDYFIDHRSELPAGNETTEVNLNDLVTKKYIEPVKDSKGNNCTVGRVVAYREGNQYKYVACLKCGDYETDNEYCKNGPTKVITVSGKTKNDSGAYVPYDVTASFNSAQYAKGDVIVTFSMDDASVKRFELENTSSNVKSSCNASSKTCSITVTTTGTYKVTAFNGSNSIIATNQYINVKIQKYNEDDPMFNIEGETYYELSASDCSNNRITKDVTFNIVKGDINKEFKTIEYNLNGGSYTTLSGLGLSLNLGSGHYSLDVKVTDFAGNIIVKNKTFDVAYTVNLEYEDDHSTATHKVVKGQTYDFLSPLPTTKKAYGVNGLEVRWHPSGTEYSESNRVLGSTTVTNNCTHKLMGLMAMPVDVPSDWTTYCNNLTYDGTKKTLTKTPPTNVTFLNNEGTNAGEYTVRAHINSPLYIWKGDWTFDDKEFKCSINKSNITVTATNQSKVYDGSALSANATCSVTSGSLPSGHSVTCTNTGSVGPNVGTATKTLSGVVIKNSGGTDVSSSFNITKGNGTLSITASSPTCPTTTAFSGTYDGNGHSITVSGGANGTIQYSTDNSTWSTTNPTRTVAGTQTTYVRIVGTGNYNNTVNCTARTITINKRSITVTATNQSKTYDGSALSANATCSVTSGSLPSGHTVTCTNTGSVGPNVGTATKTLSTAVIKNGSGTDVSSSFNITKGNGTLSIGKASSSITCANRNYTGSAQNMYSTSNGCTPATNKTATNAGTYTVTCTGDSNHTDSSCSATMNKVNASLSCTNKDWNGSSQTIATCSGGTLSNHTRTAAGTQTVTCTGDSNHNTVTATCGINKVAATLSCSNKSYTGSAQTGCSCSGGTVGGTYSATNAGTYTASCTGDSNHTNPSNKSWSISKVDCTITCSNPNYTGSSLTIASCSGGTCSNHTRTAAGSQTVTCTGDSNHNTTTKSCSVNKVAATLSCSNKSYTGSAQTGCSCSGGTVGGTYSATNVGTYTASCTGDSNHTNPSNKSWSISKVDCTITCSNPNYTGSSLTIATCSGGTCSNHTRTAAGSQTVTCTGDSNHNTTTKSCSVNKVAATLSCSNKNYTGSAQTGCSCSGGTVGGTYSATNAGTYTASCTGDSNHTNPSNKSWTINKVDCAITCSSPNYTGSSLTIATCSGGTCSNHTRTAAGSQTVTCTGDSNHNTTTKSCSVNKVAATLSCSNKNYTGSAQTGCSCSGGTVGGTYSATNAGTYTASCTGDSNHTNPSNKSWTINKVDCAITCSSPNYTGSSLTIASCSGGTCSNHTRTAAGSQTVTCTGDSNHNTTTKSCSVNKVAATLSCSNKNYTGSAQTGCSCSGGTVGGTYSATNAGTYTASCTGDSNHTNPSNKSWTINKVNASLSCANKNYNGSSQTIATCSGGTLSNHTRTAAGTQTVTCTGDSNHNTVTATCGINKVAATLSCSNKSYTGSAQTGCSCSGGTVGGTYSATNAGTYTASCTGDSNHTNPSNVSWTINKVNASLSCANKNYNGSSQTIATCSGGTLSNHTRTAAGTQTVTCTGDSNHNTVTATCGINKVAASLSCSNKNYNGSSQTACSCSGGTVGGTYAATNAGTYTASCTGDSNHTNPSNVSWTMNKVAASLSCSNKTYNGSSQTACSCSGGTVGGTYAATNAGSYTASCTGDGNHTSPGNASWTMSKTTGSASISSWPGTMPVVKSGNSNVISKTLTVTASCHSGGSASCSSSNTGIATCSASGSTLTITAKKAGSATITLNCSASTNYNAASNTYSLTVPSKMFYCICNCKNGTASGTATTCPSNYNLECQYMCGGSYGRINICSSKGGFANGGQSGSCLSF